MQTDLITKVYFNEHLTHSCVGMPQGLQALLSSLRLSLSVFLREVFCIILDYLSLCVLGDRAPRSGECERRAGAHEGHHGPVYYMRLSLCVF